ncbi:enteropeptidase isoform X1 [Lethenteron reissneri]|uniref:enteropeptidase isoform X1 n=1 Tax=Lethenteron reissneri TaxID=7753 RepID=UPI002AB7B7E2|nr:enteropeptidase isoform X1 [Lethenteron reissneri]
MGCRRGLLSPLEVSLIVLFALLLAAMIGLLAIGWLASEAGVTEESTQVSGVRAAEGSFRITAGADFMPALGDSSTDSFKVLAYDIQSLPPCVRCPCLFVLQMDSLYSSSSLAHLYSFTSVKEFKNGSVIVAFLLNFHSAVTQSVALEARKVLMNALAGDAVNAQHGTLGRFSIELASVDISVPILMTTHTPVTMTTTTTRIPITTTTTTIHTPVTTTTTTTHTPVTTAITATHTPVTMTATTTASDLSSDSVSTTGPLCDPSSFFQCRDGICVPLATRCDGLRDCADAGDEEGCVSRCDDKFLLNETSGSFHSKNFPDSYPIGIVCHWIVRAPQGEAIEIRFVEFNLEAEGAVFIPYAGLGSDKQRTERYTGFADPGSVRILHSDATIVFSSLEGNVPNQGFNATYTIFRLDVLTDYQKINCTFEDGLCYWQQLVPQDNKWNRQTRPGFPGFAGPPQDHTTGAGYYILAKMPMSMSEIVMWSLELESSNGPYCLRFWYYMFQGQQSPLSVQTRSAFGEAPRDVWTQMDDHGQVWVPGHVTLNESTPFQVLFVVQTRRRNPHVALDDIALEAAQCPEGPDAGPTKEPLLPKDCGGPTWLREPNSTFTSPNYPGPYISEAHCMWLIIADDGNNVQLHFTEFALEQGFDFVEVRGGYGYEANSTFIGRFTGAGPGGDLFSPSSLMSVIFLSDETNTARGFHANFTTGFRLGLPPLCSEGEFQCRVGGCVSAASVCNGSWECGDGSEERGCVRLLDLSVPPPNATARGVPQLWTQRDAAWGSACADTWSRSLSNHTCVSLHYPDALTHDETTEAEGYAPYVVVSETSSGIEASPVERCESGRVAYVSCNPKDCGRRPLVPDEPGPTSRGPAAFSPSGRIVGGGDAEAGAWPWAAALYHQERFLCGAALLSARWLVTAAHCVIGKDWDPGTWTVYLGVRDRLQAASPPVVRASIAEIHIHSGYNQATKRHDVAVLRLSEPIAFTGHVQPVCLTEPAWEFPAGSRCWVVGWGSTFEGGSPAAVLQEAAVPLLSNEHCRPLLQDRYNISADMVCAGYEEEGGVDHCHGDSGGPLSCERDGRWFLEGVVSFGVGCGNPRRPGVYARISTHAAWLSDFLHYH